MGAVSVGFNAIESTPRSMLSKDNPPYGKRGEYFDRAELLEISIVTIPANGEAVAAKNFIGQNRTFKISQLKHIIDVEMDGDKVIVTYLMHEDERRQEDPEMPEEEDAHHDEDSEDDKMMDDDDDKDEDKEKSFLTQIERELFALFANGE